MPPFVSGVAIVRGEPLPVVDLGRLLADDASDPRRFVAVKAGNRRLVLTVESVIGIRDVPAESFRSLPPLLRDGSTDAIQAIGTLDAELLIILQSARLVPEDVWTVLDRGAA